MNTIIFGLLTASVVASAIPLESPEEDFSQFFGSSRIVGGQDAPDNYAPYQVALVFGRESYPSLMCSGSIVSRRHVMTAAHCIDPFIWRGELLETFHARVGSNLWQTGGYTIRFKDYRNHPRWDPFDIKYDVGILFLASPLKLGERVAVIALKYQWVDGGENAFVTGWGLTSAWGHLPYELQLLDVTTISPEECAAGVLAAGQGWPTPPINPRAEICTFHSVGHGMCNGDSGSALVSQKDRKQIGIVSWGFPCAIGAPDVHTRIYEMKNFIEPILKK
ncbi:chymotrypsin-1 [Manduca sexta]|uniref:Peptidase S1 domain-containing protein n=1 Tax=Manduca sexta TaxID=7130 RepID=A0A921ZRE1_MANSE|nr:chymotrypsin-1 [Manduca sexta]KAG6462038.1 hypothetical protein O3G_MSEX013020 [Manduca sexta]KAG6462039.1 hypothetical protein O3G_MSEX013020 [Manduca sexta]